MILPLFSDDRHPQEIHAMKPSLTLLATIALLVACSRETRASASDAAQSAKTAMSSGVADFKKWSSDALATIDQKIAELKVKAGPASETAKADLDKVLADLDVQRKALGEKLEELKAAAPEKAQSMIEKVKAEMATLKKSAEDAAAKFK